MGQTVFNNFEISDLDFWRREAYTPLFNYLDCNGGIYYSGMSFTVTRRYEQSGSN